MTRPSAARRGDGQVGRGAVLRARARGPDPGRRPVPPGPRAHRRRRRLGVAGGLAAAGQRHAQHDRGGRALHARAARPNLFIKIPGTPQGLPAIEESIFAGVPINVTLLFSREQYLAAADAYMRGIERRLAAGLDPGCGSVASLFVSRWDKAVLGQGAPTISATGWASPSRGRTYRAYRELLDSPRWQKPGRRRRAAAAAALGEHRHQGPGRLGHALHRALAAPDTINTMPESTLLAFADHGDGRRTMRPTAAMPKSCSPEFAGPASTSTPWRRTSSGRVRSPSSPPGKTC